MYALVCARILPAEDSIRLERLRHLKSVVTKACSEISAQLHAEHTWLLHVQAALTWAGSLRIRAGIACPDLSVRDNAISVIRSKPGPWKTIVK